MTRLISILVFAWCVMGVMGSPIPADAPPNYFVATSGTAGGTGRMADPLDIDTVIRTGTNGAVYWLMSGTYAPTNRQLARTNVTLRAYPKRYPVIATGLEITGPSNTVRGLYFVSSHTERSLTQYTNWDVGLNVLGAGTRTIGNYVSGFISGGMGSWSSASNSLHYGDVYVGNGFDLLTNSTKHGHSIYAQNTHGTKVIALTHSLYSASTSVDLRGTSAANVDNVYFQSNFVAGGRQTGLLEGNLVYELVANRGDDGDYNVSNVWITANVIVHDGSHGGSGYLGLGRGSLGVPKPSYALHFDQNLVNAGFINVGVLRGDSTMQGNVIWTDSTSWAGTFISDSGETGIPVGALAGNTWYYAGGNAHPWYGYLNTNVQVSVETLEEWQSYVHGDSNSVMVAGNASDVVVKVWRNGLKDAYDNWWGDVAVWNPQGASNNVTVALTGLSAGARVDVRYTGNLMGPSVVRATYNGQGLSIPLKNLQTLQPNDLDWPSLPQPTNGASFRVFVWDREVIAGAVRAANLVGR